RSVITMRLPCLRQEFAGLGIVAAIGEELEHEEWVGGAALSEVDFDREMAPAARILHRDEVDAESPEDALVGQRPRDLGAAGLDLQPVFPVRRKTTAEENLTIGAAEYLIVR